MKLHRLNRQVEEVLYPAYGRYSDRSYDLERSTSQNPFDLDLPKFTLVGATPRGRHADGDRLRDRFGVIPPIGVFITVEGT